MLEIILGVPAHYDYIAMMKSKFLFRIVTISRNTPKFCNSRLAKRYGDNIRVWYYLWFIVTVEAYAISSIVIFSN